MDRFEHEPHGHELAPEDVIRFRVKTELRKRMRGLRNTFPASVCAEKSARIVAKLEAHEAITSAREVALFWPIETRHEVDLRALDAALRKRGVAVFYPAIDPETHVMTFRRVDDVAVLTDMTFGFAAPPPDAPEAKPGELDVVVVPALAIAPSGHRIGYGAGYYDRTLPPFLPHAKTIGVAYDFQILAEVPETPGDVALGFVVTDERSFAADSGDASCTT
ncbi:MAG TPA: 5-formyltetrahydrofolate cyclo-ligase [Polyangiaceae bacterium]